MEEGVIVQPVIGARHVYRGVMDGVISDDVSRTLEIYRDGFLGAFRTREGVVKDRAIIFR